MTIPSLGALVQAPRRKPWRFSMRRGRERAAVAAGNLTLASAGTGVPQILAENEPMLLHLVVEDLCWRLAVEDLRKRRPRRGDHTAQDAWLAEQVRLETERRRLAEMVTAAISTL